MFSPSPIARASLMAALAGTALAAAAQTGPMPAAQPTTGTSNERAAAEIAFVRTDANKDGKVSKDEANKLPAVSARFTVFDTDKDGALSIEEFTSGYAAKN